MWSISRRYNVPPRTIVEINAIKDVRDLKIGQTLLIPAAPASSAGTAPPARVASVAHTTTQAVSSKGFIWPLKGRIIRRYGDLVTGHKNTGIDIGAQAGQDVMAAKGGVVEVVSANPGGWGNVVVIRHNGGLHTWYAYNAKVFVKKGNWVKRGQIISQVGKGGGTAGPELHFKIFRNDKPVNPLSYLP